MNYDALFKLYVERTLRNNIVSQRDKKILFTSSSELARTCPGALFKYP